MIPTNGVHITKASYPKGFYVAKYDHEGFTTAPRWFPTMELAKAYAKTMITYPPELLPSPDEDAEIIIVCPDCGGLVSNDGYTIDPDKCCFFCSP